MDTKQFGAQAPTNETLRNWVEQVRTIVTPDQIFWVDGSEEEKQFLTGLAVEQGVLIQLNQEKLPGCYYHRSNPNDVARVEQSTFICTPSKKGAGPTNNWMPPREMYDKLYTLLRGAMAGRTMYVIPYLMGPPGSPLTKVGIEITDSIYVVLNMRIMSRMGKVALDQLGTSDDFNRGRLAMDGVLPDGTRLPFAPRDRGQGFNSILRTTHRQNFIVPPRRHRSFPLVELLS